MRRAAVLAATVALLGASLAGPVSAQEPSTFTVQPLDDSGVTIQGFKSASAQVAQSDPALLVRTDSQSINVFVKLDIDGAATYAGGIDGFAATSPAVTGKKLKQNKAAVDAYLGYVQQATDAAAAQILATVPEATVIGSYSVAYGGVLVRMPAASAKSLLGISGVVAVQQDELAQPLTDATPTFIGATEAWKSLGGSATAGKGVIVGVIDTGIWPEHPSFADPGIPFPGGGPYGCEFGDGSDPALGPAFACNDKLVGAYAFTDTYMSVYPSTGADEYCDSVTGKCSARDADGHGTHTASTSAGSGVSSVVLLGTQRGPISGIAPGASIIAYHVCLANGCFGSDSIAAVQQAILDGVDVINFSISGGASPYTDAVELAFLDAYNAGISVNASAGNSGPGAATAAHGGPWVTTVGASTSNRAFLTTATVSGGGASLALTGTSVAPGTGPAKPVVVAPEPTCKLPFPAGTLTGKIVVCRRGGAGRAEEGYNVLQGGAAGMILYNQSTSVTDLETDNHYLPAVQVQYADGQALLTFLAAHPGATASWATGTKTTVQGDVMASFSSRGPVGNDFLKPDVTAPGVSILAGHSPAHMPPPAGVALGPQGELFQAIAGTSMSSPHAAGVSALVKAAHPDWTPDMVKSALMTSSVQTVLKEDGVTPATPYDRGAGSIRADRAINPTFVLSLPAGAYEASAGDALGRVNLNLPSIQQRDFTGALTTTRTITNVSGGAQPFKVRADAAPGYTISVSPSQGALPAGTSMALTITIDGRNAPNGLTFGQVTIEPNKKGSTAVVLPIAINKVDSSGVGFSHSCDATTIDRGASAHCLVSAQNLVGSPATTVVTVAGPTNGKLGIQNPAGAPGIVPSGNGFTWTGSLSPALAPPVLSITPGGSPAGYLPLSAFGIGPIAGTGDETITNFNVPAFKYGAETYTRIGLVSDGYVVIGGGTSPDINYIPQVFPNPARPNNVVAPLWTDLNPAAGGAMRIATLTDGVDTWLVADWEDVVVYGTSDPQSFQVWIQLGDTEGVWMTYGGLTPPYAPDGANAGAENRDGTSGQNITPTAGSDWTVALSGPIPGGSVALTYDAFGRNTGTFISTASMTSSVAVGTNIKAVSITVK